ncbi:MAG: signal recognition particle protein [Alphaproteobacteria bacterium]
MFENLTGKLGDIFSRLTKRGSINEADVAEVMREIRIALLEADVALPVVKDFTAKVTQRAIGHEVLRSITPGQQVVKIVHDCLRELLGEESVPLNLNAVPPVSIMLVGLQGAGKTTTAAKLARHLQDKERKKVLMASLDTRRPAAQEQLAILGQQTGVATLPIIAGQAPQEIAMRAIDTARREGFDIVIHDTAGRLSIDTELMAEVAAIKAGVKPQEVLLVADAMLGQDAVNVAQRFHEDVGITGIVLTRIDGDARGGAALSLRSVTGQPIKFLGTGEKTDALEVFHPDRLANRILDLGDVVSLVEKAAESIDRDAAEKLAAKLQKGDFDFDDMAEQFKQMRRMGGMSGMLNLLPGVGKIKEQMKSANVDDSMLKRQEAIIGSMTRIERRDVGVLNASRRRRIALGSGVDVADVNRLVKQYLQMRDMMKQMKKMGQKGFMRNLPQMLGKAKN